MVPHKGHESGQNSHHKSMIGGFLRSAWPALAGYLAVRLVGLALLWAWAQANGKSIGTLLATRADARWYLAIAEHGYDSGAGQSSMAFFPLYPGLVRVLEPVLPLGPGGTAVLVTWVAALAAAAGLFAIGNHLYDRRVGILLAMLWGALPHAVVQSMAYTEALFTAFAVWTLFALLRRNWLTAGLLCLLAGLTRPTASALIPVVGLAALIAVFQRRDGWRPWVAMLLAPLGYLGYLGWVAQRTGRLDGWFTIQNDGWKMSFNGGRYTVGVAKTVLVEGSTLALYAVTLVLTLAVVLFVFSLLDRQPWQLLLYSALLLATSLGAHGYYHSKARFLLPAFPLLLPVAVALGRTSRPKRWIVVAVLAAGSAYLGAYLLLRWKYSP
ncbi:hypothetical protein [Micromonospora echinofusca]|nr:hypothetical protein [Micromonospora echinofusca]